MKILLIEDHVLVSQAIKSCLENQYRDIAITMAETMQESLDLASKGTLFDVIVLDHKMSGYHGAVGYELVAQAFPKIPIVILARVISRTEALHLIKLGAAGIVPKHLNAESLVNILKLVVSGDTYIPSMLLEALQSDEHSASDPDKLSEVTPRQRQVLKLLVQGMPNKAIAQSLGIEEITVKVHLGRIFKKFGARNRTELALLVTGADKADKSSANE